MDLQLAVLRHLPTPILVLSSQRIAVFANRAAGQLLASRNTVQPSNRNILGVGPTELGIKLLYNRIWSVVLDRLLASHEHTSSSGGESPVYGVDVSVSRHNLSHEERHFRILISILNADDGIYYMLSFERSPRVESKPGSPTFEQAISWENTPSKLSKDTVEKPRDISRIKNAVFDSHDVAGFILTVDEKFYLTNIKAREVLGNVMGGADGCDGSLRTRLEVWNEDFTRRLDATEFPGMKLVRAKAPFHGYRCGFIHAVTGDKFVTSVDGECLYDDNTGEFLGGLCWCREVQEYTDFLVDQQQRRLASHETICNVMPHLVWTTDSDGLCDWFSNRVSHERDRGQQTTDR